jgi:hypothetical protein
MAFDAPNLIFAAPAAGLVAAGLAWWARRRRIATAARWSNNLAARASGIGRWGFMLIGLAVVGAPRD